MAVEPLAATDPTEVAGYRLLGRLGAGGMGVVYLAFTPGGRPVALKVVRPELGDDPNFRSRFRQEISAAQRVHGLYTAQLLDGNAEDSPPWLVTAYVAGPSLAQAVGAHGPMPEQSVLVLLAGVAEALSVIHTAGLVHRDLKPSNVLLASDGPRVIDFGIARAIEATALTRTGMRVGSPQYMAPEQVRGGGVTPAADIFALGALAAYAAQARPPFGEGNDAAVLYRVLHEDADLADCPQALRSLIQECMAKDPAARPAPASVIAACRNRAVAPTAEFAASWLPPAVAADLTRHAPPPPSIVHSRPPAASLSGPPPAPPSYGGPPQPPNSYGGPPPPPNSYSGPPPAPPSYRGPPPAPPSYRGPPPPGDHGELAARQGVTAPTENLRPPASGPTAPVPRAFMLSAAATVLVAAIGLGAYFAFRPSGALTGAGSHDPCLIGTWNGAGTRSATTISGERVTFIGAGGPTQTFSADGNVSTSFGSAATDYLVYLGNTYVATFGGTATGTWTTHGAELITDYSSVHATVTVRENGIVIAADRLRITQRESRYTCADGYLAVSGAKGNSEILKRASPQ
jgi:serine/threonine kinase PknH